MNTFADKIEAASADQSLSPDDMRALLRRAALAIRNAESGANLPVYLSANNFLPFIDNGLGEALISPSSTFSPSPHPGSGRGFRFRAGRRSGGAIVSHPGTGTTHGALAVQILPRVSGRCSR